MADRNEDVRRIETYSRTSATTLTKTKQIAIVNDSNPSIYYKTAAGNNLYWVAEGGDATYNSVTVESLATGDGNHNLGIDADGKLIIYGNTITDNFESQMTGVTTGGSISYNTSATINISSGVGKIIDSYTNPTAPTITDVTWTNKTYTPSLIPTGEAFYTLMLDSTGNPVTVIGTGNEADRRNYLTLGFFQSNNGAITSGGVISAPYRNNNIGNLALSYMYFNNLNDEVKGLSMNATSASNLQLWGTAGSQFLPFSNMTNSSEPSVYPIPQVGSLGSGSTLYWYTRDGVQRGTGLTAPKFYDNNGVYTAIPANKTVIHYVFQDPKGKIYIQLGQTLYNTYTDATGALYIDTESYVFYPFFRQGYTLVAQLVLAQNATSWDKTSAGIFNYKFNASPGGGMAVPNLQRVLQAGNDAGTQKITGLSNGTIASDAVNKSQLDLKADLASPTFTGDPKAPTPATSDNDTSIATTSFVRSAISTYGLSAQNLQSVLNVGNTTTNSIIMDITGKPTSATVLGFNNNNVSIGRVVGDGSLLFASADIADINSSDVTVANKLNIQGKSFAGVGITDYGATFNVQNVATGSGYYFTTTSPTIADGLFTANGTQNGQTRYSYLYNSITYYLVYGTVTGYGSLYFITTNATALTGDQLWLATDTLFRQTNVGGGRDTYGYYGVNAQSGYTGGMAPQVSGDVGISTPSLEVRDATASTTPTNGAVTVAGGLGVGGNINVGGYLGVDDYIIANSNSSSTPQLQLTYADVEVANIRATSVGGLILASYPTTATEASVLIRPVDHASSSGQTIFNKDGSVTFTGDVTIPTTTTEGTATNRASVRATPLTGLSTATTTPVVSTDTILQGIGKLQGQLNNVGLVQGVESTKTGYWLADDNRANKGNIGTNAVDLSYNNTASSVYGATGDYSHAEGYTTIASGAHAHAEGYFSVADGVTSHAEGTSTQATGDSSHAEGGYTSTSCDYSHVEGYENTITNLAPLGAHAEGQYCVDVTTGQQHVIGIGTNNTTRKNGFVVWTDGSATLPECTISDIVARGNTAIPTKEYVDNSTSFNLTYGVTTSVTTNTILNTDIGNAGYGTPTSFSIVGVNAILNSLSTNNTTGTVAIQLRYVDANASLTGAISAGSGTLLTTVTIPVTTNTAGATRYYYAYNNKLTTPVVIPAGKMLFAVVSSFNLASATGLTLQVAIQSNN